MERFPWGVDWSYSRFGARLVKPQYSPLLALPMVYSVGTDGPVTADVVLAASADLGRPDEKTFDLFTRELKGRVHDRFVMAQAPSPIPVPAGPVSTRFTETDLAALENVPAPSPGRAPAPASHRALPYALLDFMQFLKNEGARGVLWRSGGPGGSLPTFTLSTAYRDPATPAPLPVIFVSPDHYNRMGRLLQHDIPVRVEIDLEVAASKSAVDGANVIGEIPGGRKRDEIVMIGAHLDSWVGGTGATDNAAGCAVVMETVRILTALELMMDRTVRFALWGGEEGAGLGSRSYVREHFVADNGTPKPEHAKLSAYFNLDNGTGKIRGVYTAGNGNATSMFRAWFASLGDPEVRTLSPHKSPFSSDENAFDAAGLPAFAFIQDPLDYRTRTHHTTLDTYDRLQADDLKQAAAVMATMVYAAATRDEMVPRKGDRR